jgi:CHAT domain-containing protein
MVSGLQTQEQFFVYFTRGMRRLTLATYRQALRQELFTLSTSDSLRRQRSHLAGRLSKSLFSTHIDLAIAAAQLDEGRITDFWGTVQNWKAISLSDLLGRSVTSPRPNVEKLDEQAKRLLKEERDLAEKVSTAEPYERPHWRMELRRHWVKMQSHASLSELSNLRVDHGATFEHLKHMEGVANQLGQGNESLVFVDWTQHRDAIFLFAVRVKDTSTTLTVERLDFSYSNAEKWVEQNLGIQHREKAAPLPRRIDSASCLMELSPLIEPLRKFIKRDELLVLCPTGVLNEIPLHAIPFTGEENPLIVRNPIIYTSSNAVLKSCVDAAYQKINSDSENSKFVAFGRYGDVDAVEDTRIQTMVIQLAQELHATYAVGKDLKKHVFMEYTVGADLVHYHGHASVELDKSNRSLILEPDPVQKNNGKFTLDDIFNLRLNAAHVTLLACASGAQDVIANDDPLGILTAFLCAGASSVAGTLWPTESRDARDFCDNFYQQIFENGGNLVVNLARAMQKTVLLLRDYWDGDNPYHWAQFVLRKLKPLRKSTLLSLFFPLVTLTMINVVDGAWFCRRFLRESTAPNS